MPTNSQIGVTDAEQWLKGVWPAALAQGLEAMIGAKVEVDGLPAESTLPAGAADDFWWQTEFSGMGGALVRCGCPAQAAGKVGRAALTAVGISDPSAEDARSTFREIVQQSMSAVAQGLARDRKRDVACINGRECQGSSDSAFVVPVRLVFLQEQCGPFWLAISREFSSLFAPAEQAAPQPPDQSISKPPSPKSMDILLDVELPVSVSFGRTQLPLKDVIKLTTGSILELNRSIAEPVELIVNNCVIARGEVVVIEGNYAIRIQQIISRQERLRTLY